MIRFLYIVFLILVIAFGVTFAVENAEHVQFNYYTGTIEIRLALLLAYAILLGAILGVVASWFIVIRLKRELRGLKRSEAVAKQELRNLRAVPIKDSA
jgi:putative membrane protein